MSADVDSTFYLEGLAAGEVRIQRCVCGHVQHPARALCLRCLRRSPAWEVIEAVGTLYALTSRPPRGGDDEPHVVGLVDLDVGVRMLGRLVPVGGAASSIGDRVRGAASPETSSVVFASLVRDVE
jgi:uncharacterized OB-fold protein